MTIRALMTVFDEEVLAAVRSSKSGKIAQEWNQDEIEKFIKLRQIYSIDILPDQSLYVTFALVPTGGKYSHTTVYDDFIVHPNFNSYDAFLKVAGISDPGQSKSFK